MKTAHLMNRALVRIDGEEATEFLQNLVTCDVAKLLKGEATFGALLTPQGKILFDFFCLRTQEGFLFDLDASLQAGFIKRMTFYKLRTPVEIAAVDDGQKVYALWDAKPTGINIAFVDPRLSAMGWRMIVKSYHCNASIEEYQAYRVGVGMPEGGLDYAYGEAFPHDAMMDQFGAAGVVFDKGCYVGQEVVSRMKHRSTARRRVVKISSDSLLPVAGASIEAGGKVIGTLGSASGHIGLAMVRIDRLAKALSSGNELTIDGCAINAELPDWADISLAAE